MYEAWVTGACILGAEAYAPWENMPIPADAAEKIDKVRGLPMRLQASGGLSLRTLDCHCGGEPARVVLGFVDDALPAGCSMKDARRICMEKFDHVRQRLLLEPRGYPCQNANYIFPSSMPGAAFGFVIAVTETALLLAGLPPHNPFMFLGQSQDIQFLTPSCNDLFLV